MRLFVDQLTNLDFSYLHPERGLVGETWLANIELIGELDAQGMVCDFGIVKKMMRDWLDDHIDHRLLVATKSPALSLCHRSNASADIRWKLNHGELTSSAPEQAFCWVDDTAINAESVAKWAITQLAPLFPESVKEIKLRFDHETIAGPFYHYSHGLKKHNGNCQRMAHGHRSKIEIWRNGNKDESLAAEWAKTWRDIYIGSQEDIIANDNQCYSFAYIAQQGAFALSLPQSHCYIMDSDTTVELIAQHIATTLKRTAPEDTFTVKAYEGLSKGAIVER